MWSEFGSSILDYHLIGFLIILLIVLPLLSHSQYLYLLNCLLPVFIVQYHEGCFFLDLPPAHCWPLYVRYPDPQCILHDQKLVEIHNTRCSYQAFTGRGGGRLQPSRDMPNCYKLTRRYPDSGVNLGDQGSHIELINWIQSRKQLLIVDSEQFDT